MAVDAGLSVTVSPSASAFFAGEVFTATITFRNTAPPAPAAPVTGYEGPQHFTPHPPRPANNGPYAHGKGHARAASTAALSNWTGQADRNSSGGLPGGELLSTPPRGAGSSYGVTSPLETPPFGRTISSGHAPHPSLSAAASASVPHLPLATSPSTYSPHRRRPSLNGTSLSFASAPQSPSRGSFPPPFGSYDPSSFAELPPRKGLIGQPAAPVQEAPVASSSGLYSDGPRRPGARAIGHARTQSMAVGAPLPPNGTGPGSRSVTAPNSAGPASSVRPGMPRRSNSVRGLVAAFEQRQGLQPYGASESQVTSTSTEPEESSSPPVTAQNPDFPDDAAFPFSQSSSAPAPPHFPRRPTFGHRRIPSNQPYAHNSRARLSTLSLASDGSDSEDADDEDDAHGGVGNGFYGIGKNETMESVDEANYASHARPIARRLFSTPAAAGPNGLAPPPARGHERNRSISYGHPVPADSPALTHPPNTIVLLWAFAHLEGSFEVDESLIKPAEFLEVKRLLVGGTGGVGLGGGTLEERKQATGWREWLGWGGGSGRTGGAGGRGVNPAASSEDLRGGASLEERKKKAIEERAVPVLTCPPSILAVDLVLQPGESKTYTFSIRVPADLPPSFRGKSIKFNYQLVVGTNRTAISPSSLLGPEQLVRPRTKTSGSSSRVMKIPIRLYNHVGVTGARPFYDLTNPVIYQRDEAIVKDEVEKKGPPPSAQLIRRADNEREDFENYAANLLSSIAIDSPEVLQNATFSPTLQATLSPPLLEAPPELRPEMGSHRGTGAVEGFGLEVDEADGCKAAVEIVSRNSQKVSYDINKDGNQVASLTLVKSAYRLGETVNGSVLINSGEGRVLRVSARLETHELVETTIATMPAPKMRQITRRLHAEHHEMVLDSERIGFALAIPSGATPDFGTSGVKLQWTVRLSFLVIPPSPEGPSPAPAARRGGPLGGPPPSDARTPASGAVTPPPGRASHGRSRSFAYGFEPAVPLTLPPPPPIAVSGAAHLMPVPPGPDDPNPPHNLSYRAVPDLGYVPVLFSSAQPGAPPAPGPLQKTASGASHRPTPSISAARPQSPYGNGSAVLVPAKVETVECAIPIKVYPGNTPFRPSISVFEA